MTYLECQILCQDRLACSAWTFTTESNTEVEFGCILYSDVGKTTPHLHTISGPVYCVCSDQQACSANPDNEVEVIVGVMEVRTQQLCSFLVDLIINLTCDLLRKICADKNV